jgi:hypothetical protein
VSNGNDEVVVQGNSGITLFNLASYAHLENLKINGSNAPLVLSQSTVGASLENCTLTISAVDTTLMITIFPPRMSKRSLFASVIFWDQEGPLSLTPPRLSTARTLLLRPVFPYKWLGLAPETRSPGSVFEVPQRQRRSSSAFARL